MVNVSFPIYGVAVAAHWRRFRLSDETDKKIFFFGQPEHYYQESTGNEDNEYNVQRVVAQINELWQVAIR